MNGTTRFASAGMFFAVVAVLACWLSAFSRWRVAQTMRFVLLSRVPSPSSPRRKLLWTADELWAGGFSLSRSLRRAGGPDCEGSFDSRGVPSKLRLGGCFPLSNRCANHNNGRDAMFPIPDARNGDHPTCPVFLPKQPSF